MLGEPYSSNAWRAVYGGRRDMWSCNLSPISGEWWDMCSCNISPMSGMWCATMHLVYTKLALTISKIQTTHQINQMSWSCHSFVIKRKDDSVLSRHFMRALAMWMLYYLKYVFFYHKVWMLLDKSHKLLIFDLHNWCFMDVFRKTFYPCGTELHVTMWWLHASEIH